jgi:hypothetical protein
MDALLSIVVVLGLAAFLVYKVRPDLWAKLKARLGIK